MIAPQCSAVDPDTEAECWRPQGHEPPHSGPVDWAEWEDDQ